MPVGLPDLTRQVVHIGIEPRIEQNRGIDLSRLGVIGRVVEKIGQVAEKLREDINRDLMH